MNRSILFILVLLPSCTRPSAVQSTSIEPEIEVVSATRWSKATELFVEYPSLVKGQPSRFAIHLTRLDNFRAVSKGTAEVRLSHPDNMAEVFTTQSPSRPGIFGVTVTPASTGEAKLTISFKGEGIEDLHDLGIVNILTTRPPAAKEVSSEISFLKEQQWTLDFATAQATERSLRTSLHLPAEVTPRSGGESEVDAPFDGRMILDKVPAIGSRIETNQTLASIVLPTSTPTDPTALELASAEATAQLQFAKRDRERAERLIASGAAPAKRLDEARTSELTAEARLAAAQARLKLFESSRTASNSSSARPFAIKAPIGGTLQAVKTAPGANVKAGEPLFQIVDLDSVYVSAIVPESEFPAMRTLTGAELEIPGINSPRPLSKLIMIGRIVDSPSRTFPVIYAFDNRERLVAINQTVYVRLLFAPSERKPVIPESALIDDAGNPIVYVQTSGEGFERRPVKTGQREAGMIQILDGVQAGERVVTKGGHLIRLSTMSSQAPSHGHVH